MAKPTTVDEYIASFPDDARARLQELRDLCRSAAPDSQEQLKWHAPAYVHRAGTILFMFSGHKAHMSFAVTPSSKEAFHDQLAAFETGKGTVKLGYDAPLPTELLRRMIEYRIHEFEDDGVKWMG